MALRSSNNKRATKTSQKSQLYANRAVRASRKALLHEICKGMYEAYVKNENRLPWGHVGGILEELKTTHKWLTRNIINKAFINFRKDLKSEPEKLETVPKEINLDQNSSSGVYTMSTVSSNEGSDRSRIGRPLGSTDEKRCKEQRKFIDAKNEISKKYAAAKNRQDEVHGCRKDY